MLLQWKNTWKYNLRIFCSLGDNEAKSQNEIMCDLGELAELDTVNDADPLNLLTDARFENLEDLYSLCFTGVRPRR